MKLYRPPQRKALWLPMDYNRENPGLMIPMRLHKESKSLNEDAEIDEQVRAALAKRGYNEKQITEMLEKAEAAYEYRVKVQEARRILRKLMAKKASGSKLSKSNGKWVETSFPTAGGK